MSKAYLSLGLVCAMALGLTACNKDREAKDSTGTATAVVKTDAPASQVPAATLQDQAVQAATAASKPVDGSAPVASTTPQGPAGAATPPAK